METLPKRKNKNQQNTIINGCKNNPLYTVTKYPTTRHTDSVNTSCSLSYGERDTVCVHTYVWLSRRCGTILE